MGADRVPAVAGLPPGSAAPKKAAGRPVPARRFSDQSVQAKCREDVDFYNIKGRPPEQSWAFAAAWTENVIAGFERKSSSTIPRPMRRPSNDLRCDVQRAPRSSFRTRSADEH